MLDTIKSEQVLDLHGQPKNQVKAIVTAFVEKAIQDQQKAVAIITGLGNHPNIFGKHSILFKKLVDFLNAASFRPQIKYLIKDIGLYRIIFDVPVAATSPISSHQDTPFFCEEEAVIKGLVFDPSKNPLFEVIKNSDPTRRQSELKVLLTKNPHLLHAIDQGGTTALMVAAACNQVDTMAWLVSEDRKLVNTPRPLKQQKHDGTTALMAAIFHNSQEAIDYLLKQAPSLLKKRRFDGASVFCIAAQVRDSEKTFELLYKHLEPHKRERGYTDLFREYKALKKEMAQIHPSSSIFSLIPIIESEKFKRYQLTYRWFFMDRMMQFLKKMERVRPNFHFLNRPLQRSFNQEGFVPAQVREIWRIVLRNKNIKTAFLRFNNAHKTYFEKRFKFISENFELPKKRKKHRARVRRIQTTPIPFRRTLSLDSFYICQKSRISLSQVKPIVRKMIEKASSDPIKTPMIPSVRSLVFSIQKPSFIPSKGPTLLSERKRSKKPR